MKKKILSIALALCMVLTMMPMATGVAWADTATSVTVGGVQMVSEDATTYYKNGDTTEAGLTGKADDYNAMYNPVDGTLTLKGLSLDDDSKYCIYANKDLNIVLEGGKGNANSLVHSGKNNIIYVNGNLTISGPGTLTAENGSSNLTTIYAEGDITINGGAQVTATHAGDDAQAINADNGKIEILGNGTTVKATHSEVEPTSQNPFALMADSTISVSDGATLTAKSGKQAVSGNVNIDTDNSTVAAGETEDTATSWPGDNGSNDLSDLNNYKYLKIETKAPVATALEDRIFSYAYDAQRDPAYPTKEQTVRLWDLSGPIMEDGQHGNLETLVGSKWTLTKAGTYSYMKSSGKATPNLEDIVKGVADGYSSLDPDTIVIHELKCDDTHIAYGVVVAYDVASGYALFLGDTLSGGAGYLLSTNVISNSSSYTENKPLEITAGTIATDFVQDISISLSQTEPYTFPAATVGYINPETKSVTITNTGNTATGDLTVSLSGDDAAFTLNPERINSISTAENNKTATFTVAPKTGLTAGTYTATVIVSGQNIVSKFFEVSFTVKAPSGGGSYVPTTEKPTIIADEGAETTLSILGTKLTIKVTDDYELVDVIVNGVSKGKVTELTGLKTGDKVEVKTEKKQEEPKEPTKEEIIAALDSSKLVARSKLITLKNGKKAVRVSWYDKNGKEVDFDGIEIYRSTQRYKGYGLKPFYATKDGKTEGYYVNTKDLKEGTTYYYKVRGYIEIDGQKYYTDYSLKAIRTIK